MTFFRMGLPAVLLVCAFPVLADEAQPDGEAIYQDNCAMCHSGGRMSVSNTGTWQSLIDDQGVDKLYANAIHGIGRMPAKGGHPSLAEDDVKAAVDYMLQESGATLPEK